MQRGSAIRDEMVPTPAGKLEGRDYALVRRVIDGFNASVDGGQDLDRLVGDLGVTRAHMQRVVQQWCGLSLREFAHAVTTSYIQSQLAIGAAVLDGNNAGAGPTNEFVVRITAVISDEAQRRGAGLDIVYGFHDCPFGVALVTMAEGGVCGLAFIDDDGDRQAALDDMIRRWPRAVFREAPAETVAIAARVFGISGAGQRDVIPLTLIGTAFDVRVWQTLLAIPMGRLVSYAGIARHLGQPSASRAVGTANGRNPISFIVPCHRAVRGDGTLGGYYWGLTRKRALIAWEAGRLRAAGG